LPKPEYAKPFLVVLALFAVDIALYGNIKMNPGYLVVFLQYFIPAILLIYAMLNRNHIMEFVLSILAYITDKLRKIVLLSRLKINKLMNKLHEQGFVFFSKTDDIAALNKVMIYVQENEITRTIKIVTVLHEHQPAPEKFLKDFEVLDRAYPDIKMEYIVLAGEFGRALIERLSKEWNVPKNFMFISSPGEKFSFKVEELGGVRLIL
jgi:biotin operon repressor